MTMEPDCAPHSITESIRQWSDPACLVDGEGRVHLASAGLVQLAGDAFTDLTGVDPQLLLQSIEGGEAAAWQIELKEPTGDRLDLLVIEPNRGQLTSSGRTVISPGMNLDRLSAIGEIAPPLFHDLNNMLGSISGIAELAAMKMPDGDPMKERLNRVVDTVIRASSLGRQISLFVRTPLEQPPRVELIELVEDAMVLARSYLSRGITIETRWPETRLATDLHPNSLRHLVVEVILATGIVLRDQEGIVTWSIARGESEDAGQPTARLRATAMLSQPDNRKAAGMGDLFPIGFFRRIATIASLANSFGGNLEPIHLLETPGFELTVSLPVCENTAL
jgi:hypothetical protein